MKMKLLFVSDFFKSNLIGGAELNDDVLIEHLKSNGFEVEKVNSSALTEEQIIENDSFIISNFVGLSDRKKEILKLKKYIIYEHDHKYLKTRDPSSFPDFKAPASDIVYRDFYDKAHKVVVLSEICKDVIEKNLDIDNVYNIGCSLWSDSKLDFIQELSDNAAEKKEKYCIINSSNPIKGTREAVEYCRQKGLDFDLVGPLPENELLKKISEYKYFIFFPQVLETLSRVVVEAKMLGCKVLTRAGLIGAASEEWFGLSGVELIDKIREQKKNALNKFVEFLTVDDSITVILNCYRRPEYLQEQIDAIRSQTIKPHQIWIWVNHHEDNEGVDFESLNVDRVIKNDYNWKFFGRFAGAMLAKTKYVAMFDDDTIPGDKWFENCLETMGNTEGILGGAGVRLREDKYYGHTRYGWSSQNDEIVEVDLVGHAWFFKKEWLKYIWMEEPLTWENGEDIHFSYTAQKYGDVRTYCPPHPASRYELFSSLKGMELGTDKKATSSARNHGVFYAQRDSCVKNAILNGWKPVYIKDQEGKQDD